MGVAEKWPPRQSPPKHAVHVFGRSLRRKRHERIAVVLLICLIVGIIGRRTIQKDTHYTTSALPCQSLPGAKDVVLIMKTGVTELEDRLPVHLDTTLKCAPNNVIFSDHEELYRGQWEIRDVLASINSTILETSDDFELYRRVKAVGRQGLEPAAFTGERKSSKTNKAQKLKIAGWLVDKWKFLPMLNETLYLYPTYKWYVFMETDTFMFWTTTLKYLSILDPTERIVLGHRSMLGRPQPTAPFMQGGSGYILSHAALQATVDYINAHRDQLETRIDAGWAGDITLGEVFEEAEVPLTATWPIYQPLHWGVLDFDVSYAGKNFWCAPAGSYHHMIPEAIEDIWQYEQQWIRKENSKYDVSTFISHGDILNGVILPQLRFSRYDWDNQCNHVIAHEVHSMEECQNACMADEDCLQYKFDASQNQCKTFDGVRLGEVSTGSGLQSDWIFERIERWRDELPPCRGEWYIMPQKQ